VSNKAAAPKKSSIRFCEAGSVMKFLRGEEDEEMEKRTERSRKETMTRTGEMGHQGGTVILQLNTDHICFE
jgi:hypothetical protein